MRTHPECGRTLVAKGTKDKCHQSQYFEAKTQGRLSLRLSWIRSRHSALYLLWSFVLDALMPHETSSLDMYFLLSTHIELD